MKKKYSRKEVERLCSQCYIQGMSIQAGQSNFGSKWKNFDTWMQELIDMVKNEEDGNTRK